RTAAAGSRAPCSGRWRARSSTVRAGPCSSSGSPEGAPAAAGISRSSVRLAPGTHSIHGHGAPGRMTKTPQPRHKGWARRPAAVVAALVAALVLAVGARGSRAAPAADTAATEANITRVVTSVLAESQFAHHPLDDQLAAKLLDRYLEALDGDRAVFLQSDVDEFGAYRATLSRASAAGDARPAHAIFDRYMQRL